ncbi:histidine kinase [Agrococcus versicolor]|uniref:histidine kinase n=1 Tax=Agrococcus versicolor TaxID=501482 RepID=A0ABN3AWF2_9MICO
MSVPLAPSRSRRALRVAAFVVTSTLGVVAIALVATLSVAAVPGATQPAAGRLEITGMGVVLWLGAIVVACSFLARRRLPWVALAGAAVLVLALQLDGTAAILVLGSVLAHVRGRIRWVQAGIAAALVVVAVVRDALRGADGVVPFLLPREAPATAVALSIVLAGTGLVLAVAYGLIVRASTRARRAEVDAERSEHRAGALAERLDVVDRRAELSQAMHDGVARTLTHVHLQAAVLRDQADLTPHARATADELVAQARRASIELQDVQRAIEADFGPQAPGGMLPERGLADAVALVHDARAAGHRIDAGIVLTGTSPLTPAIDRTAYWILSEALTNAAKHAPPADVIAVTVSGDERAGIRIVVENAVGDGSAVGSGTGVARMRSQAVAAGGSLSAGADERGRFRVEARLPWAGPGADLGSVRAHQDRDRRG